jgi:hypothetical protein
MDSIYGANNIGRITTAGVIGEFSIPTAHSHPFGITTGPDGNLWFAETAAGKIGRLTLLAAATPPLHVSRTTGQPSSITVSHVAESQATLTIRNDAAGLSSLTVDVNGKIFQVGALRDGDDRTLDISSALRPGTDNTVTLTGRGKPGTGALVQISS